jgi:D-sedoheptulose 7-phosphate isomerase
MHPIFEKRAPLPAIALNTDTALLTAKGNDRDYSMTFAEQLAVLARAGDVALGISTSGKSANVNRALQLAGERDLLTVGFAGRDGGRMPALCRFCFVVESFSIHRIQEAQETLLHVLWDLVHLARGEEDVI